LTHYTSGVGIVSLGLKVYADKGIGLIY